METGSKAGLKPFGLGVVVGKFLPPHRGHRYLIETALSRCEKVRVIVCGKRDDPIPADLRTAWLRELLPQPAAEVMEIDDSYDAQDSRVWAENTIRWLGRAPDAVFTSEDYGDHYAAHLGCVHVMVDRERTTIPCSGTAVRKDPLAMWEYLDPPVRAWFAKRVVVVGAESTGTTTLAADLAARRCRRVLICDTNAFATGLWHRRYLGHDDPCLQAYVAETCRADLYLLTGDEIPFVQDGLRDGEHIRHEMHRWFVEALSAQAVPWRLLRGGREERLRDALHWIEALLGIRRGNASGKS